MIRKIKKDTQVDLSQYVNKETGEFMLDEISKNSDIIIKSTEDSGMVSVSYNDYAVLDTEAFLILAKVLNNSEFANVVKMAITTKTQLNILYNNNIPHSNHTLQEYLEIKSKSTFFELIKKLMEIGVIYQIKGRIHGEVRVIYMLNPLISKKRNTFDSKVIKIFERLLDNNP